jgi:hypothetical protein
MVDLMWEEARQSNVLRMDETPVMELGGPGRTLKGYLWVAVGDADHPYDCFFYTSDRRSIGPETMLAGAINYMLNRWESFTRFLESGAVPMDNNAAERALKYPILGPKAWLFFGNQAAGETAAKLFTLTKSCNRHHIDPFAYPQDVHARLPTMSPGELPLLLPDRWIEDHPQHRLQQRVYEALDRAQRARERRAERRRAAA